MDEAEFCWSELLNLHVGNIVKAVLGGRPKLGPHSKIHRRGQWLTNLAFSPQDHDLYVCNYAVNSTDSLSATMCLRISSVRWKVSNLEI